MDVKFLKLQENNLDKKYNAMLREHSICSNIIIGENFAQDTITDSRKVYHDIDKFQEEEIIDDIKEYVKKYDATRNDFYNYVNSNWIKKQQEILDKTKLPFIKADSFRIKQQDVYSSIIVAIDDYMNKNSTIK
jgi:hypothetical protein